MIIQSVDNAYSIQENGLMRIESASGWVVRCDKGTLLITQPGFNRAYLLHEGDKLQLATDKRVLLGGGSDARFKMAPPYTASGSSRMNREDHFAKLI